MSPDTNYKDLIHFENSSSQKNIKSPLLSILIPAYKNVTGVDRILSMLPLKLIKDGVI